MIRGSSNSFGVAYEVGPDDELPGVNELIEYGERTWQVSDLPV